MKKSTTVIVIILALLFGAFATYYVYMSRSGDPSTWNVRAGDQVYVHFTWTLPDGTVADTSRDEKGPYGFTSGVGMVVPGFDEAVVGMKIGERKSVKVPPQKAFDSQGVSNGRNGYAVPPNTTLTLDVEVLNIER
ncbi:MAG TPA: FKBP-type peptidyl-prolyl cis-trans isomerase [Candidatus Paceibacterota bacterium]